MSETASHIQQIAFHLDGVNTFVFLVLTAGACAAALWYYKTTVPPVTGWLKPALTTLRLLALLALVFALARPVIHIVESVETRNRAAVLLDTSASMAFPADPSREQNAREAFGRLQDELGDSAAYYTFDRTARQSEGGEPSFDGHGTEMSAAITEVLKSDDIASVIVISDGRWNLGENPVTQKPARDAVVHGVFVGTVDGVSEFAVERISAPSVVYENETYTVEAVISSYAPTNEAIRVDLTDDGRVLDSITLDFGGGTRARAQFSVAANNPGAHGLQVSITPGQDEIVDNNTRRFSLDVLKNTFGVLVIAASPSADLAFLARAAETDRSLDTEVLVDNGVAPPPQPEKDISEYDAFVVLDGGGRVLDGTMASRILDRVAKGAGLWVAGSSFKGAGADVLGPELPVIFGGDGDLTAELFQTATEDGGRHFITAGILSPTDNRRLESLPPLERILPVTEVRESGRILARASSTGDKSVTLPSIIAGRRSAGKILVTPMSGLWRWRLMAAGSGIGDDTFYTSFVQGSMRWLTAHGEASPLTVSVDGGSFLTGQEISLEARLIDRIFMPVGDADISAVIDDDDRRKIFFKELSPAVYSASIHGLPAGDHTYTAIARLGGVTIAEHEGVFTVAESSVENIDTSPAPDVMASLAHRNGGMAVTAAGLDSLFDKLTFTSHLSRREQDHQPASGMFWAICAIIILAVEWTVRKIRGLL